MVRLFRMRDVLCDSLIVCSLNLLEKLPQLYRYEEYLRSCVGRSRMTIRVLTAVVVMGMMGHGWHSADSALRQMDNVG